MGLAIPGSCLISWKTHDCFALTVFSVCLAPCSPWHQIDEDTGAEWMHWWVAGLRSWNLFQEAQEVHIAPGPCSVNSTQGPPRHPVPATSRTFEPSSPQSFRAKVLSGFLVLKATQYLGFPGLFCMALSFDIPASCILEIPMATAGGRVLPLSQGDQLKSSYWHLDTLGPSSAHLWADTLRHPWPPNSVCSEKSSESGARHIRILGLDTWDYCH